MKSWNEENLSFAFDEGLSRSIRADCFKQGSAISGVQLFLPKCIAFAKLHWFFELVSRCSFAETLKNSDHFSHRVTVLTHFCYLFRSLKKRNKSELVVTKMRDGGSTVSQKLKRA